MYEHVQSLYVRGNSVPFDLKPGSDCAVVYVPCLQTRMFTQTCVGPLSCLTLCTFFSNEDQRTIIHEVGGSVVDSGLVHL